jgi:hypothetical protein
MFQRLQRILAVAAVIAVMGVPASAHAAAGGAPAITSALDPHIVYEYELWVRENGTRRWWLWNTYEDLGDAEFIEYYFLMNGYDTYIRRVSIYDSAAQYFYQWGP